MSNNKFYGKILTSDNLLETRLIQFPNHEDLEILLGFLEDRKTVLDLGCGTGFTCEYLAKRGKKVTGIELTEDYIIAAKRRVRDLDIIDRLDFQIGNMEKYQPQSNFDAIIFLWSVINEITTKDAQLELLKKYKTYLRPNGLLYIDTIYIPEESQRPFIIEDPISGRIFELINDEFNIRIKHHDRGSHIIRCDTPSGWDNMFNLAGYDTISCGYKCPNETKRLVVAGIR